MTPSDHEQETSRDEWVEEQFVVLKDFLQRMDEDDFEVLEEILRRYSRGSIATPSLALLVREVEEVFQLGGESQEMSGMFLLHALDPEVTQVGQWDIPEFVKEKLAKLKSMFRKPLMTILSIPRGGLRDWEMVQYEYLTEPVSGVGGVGGSEAMFSRRLRMEILRADDESFELELLSGSAHNLVASLLGRINKLPEEYHNSVSLAARQRLLDVVGSFVQMEEERSDQRDAVKEQEEPSTDTARMVDGVRPGDDSEGE